MKKTREGKGQFYHDVIVSKKLRFQNVFRPQSRRFQISLVIVKLRFCDGLTWTVGLTGEMKLCCQIFPALRGRGLRRSNLPCEFLQSVNFCVFLFQRKIKNVDLFLVCFRGKMNSVKVRFKLLIFYKENSHLFERFLIQEKVFQHYCAPH